MTEQPLEVAGPAAEDVTPAVDAQLIGENLLKCTQRLIKEAGKSLSLAAIRDMASISDKPFSPKQAVEALNETGFQSSFGKLPNANIMPGMCPMIAFEASGEPFVVSSVSLEGIIAICRPDDDFIETQISLDQFKAWFSGYTILVKTRGNDGTKSKKTSWFFNALAKGKWLYLQVILAAVISNFLGLSTSLFIMVVYDRVVPNEAIESLIALTIGVCIALCLDFAIKTLRAHFIDRAGQRADVTVARRIFERILQLDLNQKQQNSGAVASVVREFDTLRDFFTSATLVAIVDLPFVFFFIGVIYVIAGPLAVVPLGAVPLVIIVGVAIQPFLARLAANGMQAGMSKQSILVETLSGIETVRATGSGRLMRHRFESASLNQSDLGLKNRMLSQFAINFAASVQQFAQIATIFYGVFLIQDGVITMGAMIAAVILGGRTLAPLSQLASALTRANSARQAYRSLNVIMSSPEDATETECSLNRPHLSGQLEFKNVTYTFSGSHAPIVQNLSFKIPAGQKVAILGRMGSGKSTIARLAAGLITPTEGSVLLDGVDIRQINKTDLIRNVGVMLQDSWLFSGNVRENLQMGYFEYGDAQILEAAKVAGVDDFVGTHPQGYDLQVRERGEGLSGGQKQSISLARSLLHSPNLLILDEPTSSMDTATEASVLERLKVHLAGRTLLAVTHRNSLLNIVDRVLVVDAGTVVVDQTPEQLRAAQRKS